MIGKRMDDEMLMAFVDGELDAEAAQEIAAAVDRDPTLAERVERLEWSRRASLDAFAQVLAEPVPPRLLAAILNHPGEEGADLRQAPGAEVVQLKRRWQPARTWRLPLAACLALAVGLYAGTFLGGLGAQAPAADLIAQAPALLDELQTRPSGQPVTIEMADGVPRQLSILGSYRVAEGLCRVFVLDGAEDAPGSRGLACDDGGGYHINLAVREPAGGGATFAPASDRAAGTIDAYLDAREASAALNLSEEGEALQRSVPR